MHIAQAGADSGAIFQRTESWPSWVRVSVLAWRLGVGVGCWDAGGDARYGGRRYKQPV